MPMCLVETARLHLRTFTFDDLENLATLLADRAVMRYVGDGNPATRQETADALQSIIRHWERHGFGRWAAIDKVTGNFVGFGGLRSFEGQPELVYHLASSHWGRGLATELALASLRFGFEEHQFARIVALAKPANAKSIRVMEKVGLRYERHTNYLNIDVVQYGIDRTEFDSHEAPYQLTLASKVE
jgi:RimJ/RimL family protein N-acetyltransferase